jgi:fumarylpyruvate hydrolase
MRPPPLPLVPLVPIAGGGVFGVRRIWCVGRNYAAHAREMGADPEREAPFFFAKPADAVLTHGADMPFPPGTEDLQHEVELVVAIGAPGHAVSRQNALGLVFGYAAGLDMTRRDLQAEAKRAGRPWEMGKAFDASAPIGEIAPAAAIGHPGAGEIRLEVNGQARQAADLADMIWPVPAILEHLSRLVALAPGDLVFTGTPEGVARCVPGDRLHGTVAGVGDVTLRIR